MFAHGYFLLVEVFIYSDIFFYNISVIQSEDYIDESCCSERCARKFIFTLDNNIAMMYSKTVAFDIILTDDREWQQQQQQQQEAYSSSHEDDCHAEELPLGQETGGAGVDQCAQLQATSEHVDTETWTETGAPVPEQGYTDVSYQHQEQEQEQEQGQGFFSPPAPPSEEEQEWSIYHNEDGEAYFYNNFTQESQWEMPPGFVPRNEGLQEQEQQETDGDGDEDEAEADAMAALMLKLSSGFKAGHVTADQRQKFMTDIIDCRDMAEMHRDLNAIFDQASK